MTASGDHPSNNNFLGETLFFFKCSSPCDFSAIFQLLFYSILYFYLYVVCFVFFNVKVDIPSFSIWGDILPFRHSAIPPFPLSCCRVFLLGYRLAASRLHVFARLLERVLTVHLKRRKKSLLGCLHGGRILARLGCPH